ncbi:hypothetical protein ALC60_00220, partial [Trachymyrmex zeteki]
KRLRLSTGNRQSVIACIARLESLKDSVHGRFVHAGAGYGLRWREIETAFESRILTGAVINSNYIEPRRFLEDTSEIVLESVQCVLQRYDINTVFNGEFVAGDKRANKSIATRNHQLYQCTDLRDKHVNLLYVEDDSAGHFAMIKDLSRLVRLQITRNKNKKYFCDSAHWKRWLATHNPLRTCINITTSSVSDKLASFLNDDKLRVLRREFSDLSEEDFNLLTRKGVFPYEYIDCSEKLNELCLPPRESFYSSLTDNTVSESDYAHAVNMWQRFSKRSVNIAICI